MSSLFKIMLESACEVDRRAIVSLVQIGMRPPGERISLPASDFWACYSYGDAMNMCRKLLKLEDEFHSSIEVLIAGGITKVVITDPGTGKNLRATGADAYSAGARVMLPVPIFEQCLHDIKAGVNEAACSTDNS